MRVNRIVERIISRFGSTVRVKRRSEHVEDSGSVYFTYSDPEVKKAMVTPITPPSYVWELHGIRVDGEYLATFTKDTTISEGDLVEINDQWYEVVKLFNRGDFKEAVLRQRST